MSAPAEGLPGLLAIVSVQYHGKNGRIKGCLPVVRSP